MMNTLYMMRRYRPKPMDLGLYSQGRVQGLDKKASLKATHMKASAQAGVLNGIHDTLGLSARSLARDELLASRAYRMVQQIGEKFAFIEATIPESMEQAPVRTIRTPRGSTGGILMATTGEVKQFNSPPATNRVYQAGMRLGDMITHVNGFTRQDGNLTTIWNAFVGRNPNEIMQINYTRAGEKKVAFIEIRDVSIYENVIKTRKQFNAVADKTFLEIDALWQGIKSFIQTDTVDGKSMIGNVYPSTQTMTVGLSVKPVQAQTDQLDIQNYAKLMHGFETTYAGIKRAGFLTEEDLPKVQSWVQGFKSAFENISRQAERIEFAREFAHSLAANLNQGSLSLIEADMGADTARLMAEKAQAELRATLLPLFSSSRISQDLNLIKAVNRWV